MLDKETMRRIELFLQTYAFYLTLYLVTLCIFHYILNDTWSIISTVFCIIFPLFFALKKVSDHWDDKS